jgi:hypothetical protein
MGLRVAEPVQPALDLAGLSKVAKLGIAQRFPRPRQHTRVVTGNLQVKPRLVLGGGGVEHAPRGAAPE